MAEQKERMFVEITDKGTVKKHAKHLRGAEKDTKNLVKSAGALALAYIGTRGVVEAFKFTVGAAIKLEKGLREVGTLMGGLSKSEMKAMANSLRRISIESGQALDKLVKAEYDIISAGFSDAADAAILLKQSTDLAVGGVTDVSVAADLLTTAVNAYGLSVEDAAEVSDDLFTIVRLGKTTMDELGQSLGTVIGIAGQAGVELDEVGAAVATLTASGIDTPRAVTAIRAAIVGLEKPTETAALLIEQLGFESGRALVKAEGFGGALNALKIQALASGVPLTKVFESIEALQAVLPLTGTAAVTFANNLNEMASSAGATDAAVAEMSQSAEFQLNRMKAAFSAIGTEIGVVFVPAIADAAEAIANLFRDEDTKRLDFLHGQLGRLEADMIIQTELAKDASLWQQIWATGGTGNIEILEGKILAVKTAIDLVTEAQRIAAVGQIELTGVISEQDDEVEDLTVSWGENKIAVKDMDAANKNFIITLARQKQALLDNAKAAKIFKDAQTEAAFASVAMADDVGAAIRQIIKAEIAGAIAVQIKKILTAVPFPLNLVLAAGAGVAVNALFNQLPGFAKGTRSAPGGLSLVGEEGPELMNIPRGAQIIPNNRSRDIINNSGGNTINVSLNVQALSFDNTVMDEIEPRLIAMIERGQSQLTMA